MDTTKEEILSEIKKAANGKTYLSRSEFHRLSGISNHQILKFFNSWSDAINEAGLSPYLKNLPLSDDDLFINMLEVFEDSGEICTRTKFDKDSKYSVDTYKKRFGRWNNILIEFRKWLDKTGKTFNYIDQLPQNNDISKIPIKSVKGQLKTWTPHGTTMYGSILNFRGLQHAPVNEQGVVFLFGMICSELGFIVESIQTGFPDCEAKRHVGKDRWERIRIEFEYKSGEFKQHGHNPQDCELIVCWENNWRDCPIDVLELKTELLRLNKGS